LGLLSTLKIAKKTRSQKKKVKKKTKLWLLLEVWRVVFVSGVFLRWEFVGMMLWFLDLGVV